LKRRNHKPDFKAKVVLEVLREEKPLSEIASKYSINPNLVRRWKTEAVENMAVVFEDSNKEIKALEAEYEVKIDALYKEIGQLTTELSWFKKNLNSSLSRVEKQSLIDWNHPDISVTQQCQLLDLNRSTLYYKPIEPSPEEIKIKHRIDEIYTEFPFYGYRKITEQLKKDGFKIGTTAVRRHMREMGIMAIYPAPNTSKRNIEHKGISLSIARIINYQA